MPQHVTNRAPGPTTGAGLKRAATIGLIVSAAACAGLLVVLFALPEGAGTSYASIVAANSLASRNFGPALLVYGLAMIAFAGAFTSVMSLYGSFRVAGPIYRFEQNLKLELERAASAPVPIRHTDELQAEWLEFRAGVMALREVHEEFSAALTEAARKVAADEAIDRPSLGEAIDQLKQVASRVRL
jgi:hypothetical protein